MLALPRPPFSSHLSTTPQRPHLQSQGSSRRKKKGFRLRLPLVAWASACRLTPHSTCLLLPFPNLTWLGQQQLKHKLENFAGNSSWRHCEQKKKKQEAAIPYNPQLSNESGLEPNQLQQGLKFSFNFNLKLFAAVLCPASNRQSSLTLTHLPAQVQGLQRN